MLPLGAIRFSKASPVGVLCPTRTHLLALIPLFRRFHTLNVVWEVSYREGFANNELLPSTKDSLRYLVCHKTGKETVSKTSYTSKNSLPCKRFNLLPVRSVKNKKKLSEFLYIVPYTSWSFFVNAIAAQITQKGHTMNRNTLESFHYSPDNETATPDIEGWIKEDIPKRQ